MTRLVLTVAVAALAAPALAQDPTKTETGKYKVVAESADVRVLSVAIPAGDKGAMHEHPDHFAFFRTDGTFKFSFPDGTSRDLAGKANEALFAPAGKHQPENKGGAFEAWLVEVKRPAGKTPAAAPAAPPAPRPGEGVPTVLVTNDRGTAVRVKIEPGFAEAAGTTHEFDTIVFPLATDKMTLEMDGKTIELKAGQPVLIPRGKPHAAKASGSGEVIVVRVM